MPTSWDQKRQQIASALAGSGGPGWGGFAQSVGAGISANPLMRWGPQGAAAPEMAGGSAVDPQLARMQQMPGFNYVPPPTGPAPTRPAGAGGAMNVDDMKALLFGVQTPGNANAYGKAFSQGAYNYGRSGDRGGYSTSGRGGSSSSSSARGGGFRGF